MKLADLLALQKTLQEKLRSCDREEGAFLQVQEDFKRLQLKNLEAAQQLLAEQQQELAVMEKKLAEALTYYKTWYEEQKGIT